MGMTEEDRRRLKGNSSVVERLAVKPLDAAMMLGESRSTVYRLIHAGKLEAVKSGAATLVLVSSLRKYLAELPRFGEPTKTADAT
jgi:excisionase family DNA binding protein